MRPYKIFLLALVGLTPSIAFAALAKDIFSLSLEELLSIELSTGSLLSNDINESASAITVIRRDQIEISGAKNLANLLEQHVPGMMLMSHSEGDKIGLRGHIAAENYKLLLLVNGKNITNMIYEGAILEIDQWEMGDIERVEVIRGPGSVTYGTGAIAGVINIITKTSKDDLPTLSVSVSNNSTYDSDGISFQFSKSSEKLGVYGFLSYRETDGYDRPDYFRLSESATYDGNYIGQRMSDTLGPQDYLADGIGRPQIKAHLDINYGENFNAWMRYTQSGQTEAFNKTKTYEYDAFGNPTDLKNNHSTSTRSFILSSDYKIPLNDTSSVKTSLTFDSQEYIRRKLSGTGEEDDIDSIADYAFTQSRLTSTTLYHWSNSAFDLVAGYEYKVIKMEAPWGKSDDELLVKENPYLFVNDIDTTEFPHLVGSRTVVEVGSGLTFQTHSHLLESNYKLTENVSFQYAHRIDFPDVSSKMFSPRLSVLTNFDDSTLVATVQRAQRMMPLRAQYLDDKFGDGGSRHETIDGLELSYTLSPADNTTLNVRSYYNEVSAVGYTGQRLEFLTDIELFGLELVGTYKYNDIEITINHSYLDTLDVQMNDELKDGSSRNNISYADYYYQTGGSLGTGSDIPLLLESYGDSLNNWSNNSTKILYTQKFLDRRLTLHLNAQIFWDYEGSYDELRMYERAYNSYDTTTLSVADKAKFDEQKAIFEREKQALEDEDAYKIDYALNAAISYTWSKNKNYSFTAKFFADNILNSKKRYEVSTGSGGFLPARLSFMEEPVSYGLSFKLDYK